MTEVRPVVDSVPPDPPAALLAGRVGNVAYLNSVPLTWGWERHVLFAPPSRLAALLQRDQLDAAVVSITEVLFTDRYDVLDGVAIAARGAVASVFLAHRVPLEAVTTVACDEASLTSVNLLRVLLGERGLRPQLRPLGDYAGAPREEAVLLIGDRALEFARGGHAHRILDLGADWFAMTGLPFVFAAWALRRGAHDEELRRGLRAACRHGVASLPRIVAERTEFDREFRQAYFDRHVYFALGAEEKRGLARFVELLRRHAPPGTRVSEPQFV